MAVLTVNDMDCFFAVAGPADIITHLNNTSVDRNLGVKSLSHHIQKDRGSNYY